MDKFFTGTGNIRKDHFGRIVIDNCPSDSEHLCDSKTDPVQNRPLCRKLVEEAFEGFLGKTGTLVLTISLKEESVGAVPTETHTAKTVKYSVAAPGALAEAVVAALEQLDGN
jgi:hypothetical protein